MRGLIILCLWTTLAISCKNKLSENKSSLGHYKHSEALQLQEEKEIEPPRTAEPSAPMQKGPRIIKKGQMSFEVSEIGKAKSKVDSILTRVEGYYESEAYNAYGNRLTYSLRLRMPYSKFDSMVIALENGIGQLKSKNLIASDVTEEYVDINIRLENKMAYLSQYQTILTKAKTIKEILEVQEKIRHIEEEIESKKGRLKYLDDKVNFSTLNLEVTELISREISNQPGFGWRIGNAFRNGVQGFLSFLVGMVNFWPFIILCLLLILGRKRISRLLKRK